MRKMMMTPLMALLLLGPAAHLRAGEDSGSGSELSKVPFGERWYGADLKPDDLKGRVTLLAFWGFG